uniref:Transmembrane protein n=1 Tax=viral metagenome TaxID=1070528 RepID=A0A6C0DWD0_9ZZZZ
MFIVSQILLNQTNVCETKNISTYAIALGLTTYAIVYVYMLFYNTEGMSSFNNYIFYLIGIDLFLSAFYSYYQSDNKRQQFTKLENSKKQDHANINVDPDQDKLKDEEESDVESEESDEESDEEAVEKISDEELTQRLQNFIKQEQIDIEENKVEETKVKVEEAKIEKIKVDEIDTKSDSEVEMNQKPQNDVLLDSHSEPIEQSDTKKRRGRPSKAAIQI